MAIDKSVAMRFTPKGLSDAYDSTDAFPGACQALTNLVFDQGQPEQIVARAGVLPVANLNQILNPPVGVISIFTVIGNIIYGMCGGNTGYDFPFCYDLNINGFRAVAYGVHGNELPKTQPTTGAWTPPTMASAGVYLVVTHPGWDATVTPRKFGTFDLTTPTAPIFNVTDLATNALTGYPTSVSNFNNRLYFAVGNQLQYSDVLTLTRTNASQFLVIGDVSNITAQSGLPLQTTSSGIAQSLLIFKALQTWQLTGDSALQTLALQFLSLSVGTVAPRSVVPTSYGTYFVAPTGPYMVDQFGTIRPITNSADDTTPDIVQPFLNCTQPSRVAAAYTGSVYRICIDSVVNGVAFRGDYWFDEHVRRWTGPHSFSYDCGGAVTNPISASLNATPATFILASNNYPAQLFSGRVVPDLLSVQSDGYVSPFGCTMVTSFFPKTGRMAIKQVVESTVELAAGGNPVTFTLTAAAEGNLNLGSVAMTVTRQGTLWGSNNWGDGSTWQASLAGVITYAVPWATPLVFEKMRLTITTPPSSTIGLTIGSFFARYQETGYQTMQQPGASISNAGAVPSPPYGAVAYGTTGLNAYYVSPTLIAPLSWLNTTLNLTTFTTTQRGVVPPPNAVNGYFLRDDGTWAQGGGGGGGSGTVNFGTINQLAYYPGNGTAVSGETRLQAVNMPALTGDVTTAGGTLTTVIPTNQVQLTQIQQISGSGGPGIPFRVLGNPGYFTDNIQLIDTGTIWANIVSTGSAGVFGPLVSGLAPSTGGSSGRFLRDDATWHSVPGLGSAPAYTYVANFTNGLATPTNVQLAALPITSYAANVTLGTAVDFVVFLNANAGSFVVTLSAANALGAGIAKVYSLRRIDSNASNTITINRAGSDLIEGATSFNLLPNTAIKIASDGSSNWWII